ncbi:MAG: two pore domain potassium channel family protein [Alphaproteobacteria bacterium]|nr:two pore domain potassium channel family protein [Alphaproteobacteria bacterium]
MDKLVRRVIESTDTFRELLILYLVVVLAGAAVFCVAEQKPFWDSLWWAVVTAMTVGYGDFAPVTVAGRIAGMVVMHVVPLFIIPLIIVRLLTTFVKDQNQFTHAEQERIMADLARIKKALNIPD